MKRIVQLLILFVGGQIIFSCDCLQHTSGYVLDYETKLPLDSVLISRYFKSDSIYPIDKYIVTNEKGFFEFTGMTGGLFGCPKLKLEIEKQGYENIIKKYRSCCTEKDTILLRKIK